MEKMASVKYEVCEICNDSLRDPRILKCFHSFCLKCLEYVSKTSLKCPTCHIKFEVPEGGLRNLKKYELIEFLTKPKTNVAQCDCCKEGQATKYCVDCSFNYCSTCLDYHGRIPSSKIHQLEGSTSLKGNAHKYSTCREHLEAMTLFCEECKMALCDFCLILKHNFHKLRHITECCAPAKGALEQDIKITEIIQKEEFLRKVVSNHNSSDLAMSAISIKASNLNKEIQQRNEDLKKQVDAIISDLIKDVDEKLEQGQKHGKDILNELKRMETDLCEQIDILREKDKNLNYENVSQASLQTAEWTEDIPKYHEDFNFLLLFDRKKQNLNLKKVFGNIGKGKLKPTQKITLPSDLPRAGLYSFAVHRDSIFTCATNQTSIFIFKCSESIFKKTTIYSQLNGFLQKEAREECHGIRFQIQDLLVIGDVLFLSVMCDYDLFKIVKIHIPLGKSKPTTIYSCHLDDKGTGLKLRKKTDGDILAFYFGSLLHLNLNGEVLKKIDYNYCKVPSPFYDVLQLEDGCHVVICESKVRIIDNSGTDVAFYTAGNKSFAMYNPTCMVKDRCGDIYIGDGLTHRVFILDGCLHFKECHEFGQSIHGMLYNEERHELLILSDHDLSIFLL